MKRKPLDTSAFADAAIASPDPVAVATTGKRVVAPVERGGASTREGKVQIQGYYPEETRRRLKMLAAKEGKTIEALLGEAIGDLMAKYQ
jgi:hypothetical protein